MNGRAYGWVNLSVADKDNSFLSTPYSGINQTSMSTEIHSDEARAMLWRALNRALNVWPENGALDEALATLEIVRQSIHKPASQR